MREIHPSIYIHKPFQLINDLWAITWTNQQARFCNMSSYRRLVYGEDGWSAVEFLSIRFCCYSSDFECLYLFIIAFLLECSQTPDLIESRGKHGRITRESLGNPSTLWTRLYSLISLIYEPYYHVRCTLGSYIDQTWLFCNKIVIIVMSRSLTQKRLKHAKFCWKILATNQIVNNFRPVVSTIRSLIL